MPPIASQFRERFRPFEKRYGLHPASYQIRNDDGSPGGWIALVEIWENKRAESIAQQLYEADPRVRQTREEADAIGLWMGLEWLEKNATPAESGN